MNGGHLVGLPQYGRTCPSTELIAVCPSRSTAASIANILPLLFEHIFLDRAIIYCIKIKFKHNPPPPAISDNCPKELDATFSWGSFHVPFCFANYDNSPPPMVP